ATGSSYTAIASGASALTQGRLWAQATSGFPVAAASSASAESRPGSTVSGRPATATRSTSSLAATVRRTSAKKAGLLTTWPVQSTGLTGEPNGGSSAASDSWSFAGNGGVSR